MDYNEIQADFEDYPTPSANNLGIKFGYEAEAKATPTYKEHQFFDPEISTGARSEEIISELKKYFDEVMESYQVFQDRVEVLLKDRNLLFLLRQRSNENFRRQFSSWVMASPFYDDFEGLEEDNDDDDDGSDWEEERNYYRL